jgi:hypothetical protein
VFFCYHGRRSGEYIVRVTINEVPAHIQRRRHDPPTALDGDQSGAADLVSDVSRRIESTLRVNE